MALFLSAPQFAPPQPPVSLGAQGTVLTVVGKGLKFKSPSGQPIAVGYVKNAPTAGRHDNFAPTGLTSSVNRLDVDTTAGNIELTGIIASVDGGFLIVRNVGANLLLLDSESAFSNAANRIQLPAQMALPQFNSILLCYYGASTTINRWAQS